MFGKEMIEVRACTRRIAQSIHTSPSNHALVPLPMSEPYSNQKKLENGS